MEKGDERGMRRGGGLITKAGFQFRQAKCPGPKVGRWGGGEWFTSGQKVHELFSFLACPGSSSFSSLLRPSSPKCQSRREGKQKCKRCKSTEPWRLERVPLFTTVTSQVHIIYMYVYKAYITGMKSMVYM